MCAKRENRASRVLTAAILGIGFLGLAACGTRYQVPELSQAHIVEADRVIADERSGADDAGRLSEREAVALFIAAADRIEPVAEDLCRTEHPDSDGLFCDFRIGIDEDPEAPPNAYQTLGEGDQPVIVMTQAFLVSVRNEDEIAFVLGHEAGHHIAGHLVKKRNQTLAGAAAMGTLTAILLGAAGAYEGHSDPAATQQSLQSAMLVGGTLGQRAYSQTFELEADMLGAYIAERAGYDPERGARVFARLSSEPGHVDPGKAAFWSTHPRSPDRIATVAVTVDEIRQQRERGLTPRPRLEE